MSLLARAAPHALILSMAAFVVILAVLEPAFLSGSNLIGILRSVSLIGIMALGMTFVIMTGGIDLSVGPVSAIAGLVAYFTTHCAVVHRCPGPRGGRVAPAPVHRQRQLPE